MKEIKQHAYNYDRCRPQVSCNNVLISTSPAHQKLHKMILRIIYNIYPTSSDTINDNFTYNKLV